MGKSSAPRLAGRLDGGVTLGFALTGGNSEAKNLALALNGVRTGWHDKVTLYEGSVYATNDLPGVDPHVTSNSNKGGIRYDHDIRPRLFAFVNADFSTMRCRT